MKDRTGSGAGAKVLEGAMIRLIGGGIVGERGLLIEVEASGRSLQTVKQTGEKGLQNNEENERSRSLLS